MKNVLKTPKILVQQEAVLKQYVLEKKNQWNKSPSTEISSKKNNKKTECNLDLIWKMPIIILISCKRKQPRIMALRKETWTSIRLNRLNSPAEHNPFFALGATALLIIGLYYLLTGRFHQKSSPHSKQRDHESVSFNT